MKRVMPNVSPKATSMNRVGWLPWSTIRSWYWEEIDAIWIASGMREAAYGRVPARRSSDDVGGC